MHEDEDRARPPRCHTESLKEEAKRLAEEDRVVQRASKKGAPRPCRCAAAA